MNLLRKLLPLLLVFSVVYGQPVEKKTEIRNFRGLNTVAGDFAIQPMECRKAHNIDWGRNVGSISKRYGFDSISVINGMDSILGIYAAYYTDGTQQLFIVADLADTTADVDTMQHAGHASVFVTPKGSVNLSADSLTMIWEYWGPSGRPSFAMANDWVYIVNGQHRGIMYNGTVARRWPPAAPGEIVPVPLNDSVSAAAYGLVGSYRYMIKYWDADSADGDNLSGYVTAPVKVPYSGKIMLTGLTWPSLDSLNPEHDSISFQVWRSKGDIGVLDASDSLYFIIEYLDILSDSLLSNLIIVDSVADSNLSEASGTSIFDLKDDTLNSGRDSLGVYSHRYGMVGYKSQNTTITYLDDTASDYSGDSVGVFYGIIKQTDTLGVAYVCTFIDTITGIESDTSRSMWAYCDADDPARSFTVYLPNSPFIDSGSVAGKSSGLVKNLYRAHIFQQTYDSLFWADTLPNSFLGRAISTAFSSKTIKRLKFGIHAEISELAVDTVLLSPFYLVAQYHDTVDEVSDSVRYDSLYSRRVYSKSAPPALAKQIYNFQGRIWSIDDRFLWKSSIIDSPVDTLQGWGQADAIGLGVSDGDIPTLIFPRRQAMAVFKNFSSYNIFQDGNLNWSRTEVSGTFGCVAPNSYAKGFGGHYYLSDAGVVRENEGATLERTQSIELISTPIRSFDNMSVQTKSAAVGFYTDRKYMLNVPAVGTTYVYDERANAWSTWDMLFSGASLYGVETNLGFFPGDTMYFFNDSVLYRYGKTTELDYYQAPADTTGGTPGRYPEIMWHSAPLFVDPNYNQISKVGLFRSGATGDSLRARVFNADSSSFEDQYFNPLTDRYSVEAFAPMSDIYLYLMLFNTVGQDTLVFDSTVIDGIDIWYTDQGEVKVD